MALPNGYGAESEAHQVCAMSDDEELAKHESAPAAAPSPALPPPLPPRVEAAVAPPASRDSVMPPRPPPLPAHEAAQQSCPLGHALQQMTAGPEHGVLTCDDCSGSIEPNSLHYSCLKCDYDRCNQNN